MFHRERCIRNWMMVGGEVPEEIRAKMGNRLIGCCLLYTSDAADPGIVAKLPACRLQRRYVAHSAADAAIASPIARRQHTRGVGTLAVAGGYFFFERIVIE